MRATLSYLILVVGFGSIQEKYYYRYKTVSSQGEVG